MTLKSCSPIVGVDVMSFDTERDVFLAWKVRSSILILQILILSIILTFEVITLEIIN